MDTKNIKLTSDSLTNIKIMTPFLGEKERAAVSTLMFGVELGKWMKAAEIEEQKHKEADQERELVQQ